MQGNSPSTGGGRAGKPACRAALALVLLLCCAPLRGQPVAGRFLGPEPWWWAGEARPLWRQESTGLPVGWAFEGGGVAHGVFLDPNGTSDPGWRYVGQGDLTGDGKSDLVWYEVEAHRLVVWASLGGSEALAMGLASPMPAANWEPVGVGDLDRDGHPDLLWWNRDSGRTVVWWMHGLLKVGGTFTNPDGLGDAAAKPVGVADFTGDGWPDLLWRRASGDLELWTMQGASRLTTTLLTPSRPVDTNWEIAGVADIDRDGWPDLLWRNRDSAQVVTWLLAGSQRTSGRFLKPRTDLPFP